MSKNVWKWVVAILALAAFAAGAMAQQTPEQFGTPDNLPPALEDICDMTTGAANGLCTAYCEAMDCDSEAPHASANACSKVEQRYTAITGEILPCIRTCPCWEASDLNNVTAENNLSFASCANNTNAVLAVIQNDGSNPGGEGGFASLLDGGGGASFCFTRDFLPFVLEITLDEAQACRDQIIDRCAAIGSPIP